MKLSSCSEKLEFSTRYFCNKKKRVWLCVTKVLLCRAEV